MAPPFLGHAHEDAFDHGFLQVDDIHSLHYEQYGRRDGKAVLFLHGGPGGSTNKSNTLFFDPAVYRVVLFDQRGAGRSKPCGELRQNTTPHLLKDIELLRSHVGVHKWHVVFGGSWGSLLAIVYAQAFPERVATLVLRGVLLGDRRPEEWTEKSARTFFPDHYDRFLEHLPEAERTDPLTSYYNRLTSDDYQIVLDAALSWNRWSITISSLTLGENPYAKLDDENWVTSHARLEAHYFSHGCFLDNGPVMSEENLSRIRHIPTSIVQGRYDVICSPKSAWRLHKALPQSEIHWADDSGHAATEPATARKLTEVCDQHAKLTLKQALQD